MDNATKMSTARGAERRPDRRVNRTRRQLRDALFSLILEKGYEAVTVEEITDRADLGRTTFYLHYHDKEDLMVESIGELVDDLVEQMAQVPLTNWQLAAVGNGQVSPALVLPFQHVAQNARLYRIVLRGAGPYSMNQRLRQIIIQASQRMFGVLLEEDQLAALSPQVPMPVFINYIAGAWEGLITWWLENDMPYPAEQIALMFQRMVMLGAAQVLGIPHPANPDSIFQD